MPARINIFTQNTLVRNAIKNGWAKKWQKENWKNSSGKLIENAELWSQLLKSEEQHKLTAALKRDEESHGWSLQQLDRIADEYYKRKG